MFNRLRIYVTPPVFEGDEEKTYAAGLLSVVLWAVMISAVAYSLIAPIIPSGRLQSLLFTWSMVGLVLGGMFALRRGYVRAVAIAVTSGMWLILIGAAFFNGGVQAPGYGGCIIVVLIAGLVLGWRAGFLTAIVTVAAGGWMLWLAINGRLPAWDETNYLPSLWLAQSVFFAVAALLLALALRTINRALQRALREVAERTKAEQAWRDSEQRFRAIFDSVNDAIFVHELETGRILTVNRRMCEMYGYTLDEAPLLTVEDVSAGYEPYRQQDALGWLAKAAAGEPQIFDWLAKDRQGRLFWVEINMRRARVDRQERLLVVARNIADRKQAERVQTAMYRISEVAQTTRNLDELYPAIHAIIGLLMPARNFYIALYDSAVDLLTVPYMMDEFDRAWPPYHPERGLSAYVMRTGQPLLATPEVFAKLEAAGEVEILAHPMVDWLGVPLKTPQGIIGVMAIQTYSSDERLKEADKDILMFVSGQVAMAIERKRVEEELRRSEAQLRLVTENMADTISQIDAQYQFVYVSPSIERVFGYAIPDLLAQSVFDYIHPDDAAHVSHQLLMARGVQAASIRIEYRYQHADGHYRWVESEVRLLYEQAELTSAVLSTRDISGRKQFEIEREALIEELESKNADLERFTYTVSHDLKSPLITIRGFLGFLEQDIKSGNQERFRADLARIAEATTRMQRLLNELLDLSRIGRITTKRENISLTAIAQEAVEIVHGRIAARGVQVEIAPDMPVIYGERARLVEVLQNLVDNAVKFMGDQPEPRITIGALGTEETKLPIFFVQDNGIGIDPRYHTRVFGLFDKLDAKTEGTGVGLALVKRIVDVHGGQIWVKSDGIGRGTTFFFTLPRWQEQSD